MENYKSNSMKSQEQNEKKVDKVNLVGDVSVRKKGELRKIADSIISDDIRNVKDYILFDVLIPTIKKAIGDVVTNGIDMILWGEAGHSARRTPGIKTSYSNYKAYNSSYAADEKRRLVYSYEPIEFDYIEDAREVLHGMIDILERYDGKVSVNDMYDLAGMTGSFTDCKYGWTDLKSVKPILQFNGKWVLDLPKARPI